MKKSTYLIILLILLGCSSTRITESWRNPEYIDYQPNKILILGITPNLTVRNIYEEKLTTALENKGIKANESFNIFNTTFTDLRQSEEDIETEIKTLSKKGFDAIIISAVKGYDERISYSGDLLPDEYNLRQFAPYYHLHQEVYFDENLYEEYKVYHIEISLYDLTIDTEKSLVWIASYDIIDPKKINNTIKDCVSAIINSLEKEGIIPSN